MSDPRLPLAEEEDDLGEIEESPEDQDGDGDAPDGEDTAGDEAGEADDGAEEVEEARLTPRRERARDTIRTLRTRAQTAEERIADLERRLAEPPRPAPQTIDPYAQQRALEAERERVAQLMPHEAAEYWANKAIQQNNQANVALRIEMLESRDQASFDALKASNVAAARLAQQVEADVRQLRAVGIYTIGRREAFYARLGQEVAERGARAAPRQRAAAARRVAGQTVRPGSGRGGVATGTGNRVDADEALLRSAAVRDGLR